MLGSYKSEMEVSNNYRAAIEADSNWELQFSGGESSFGYEDARCTGMYGMPCDAVTERPGQPSDDGDTFTPPFVKDVKRDTERLAELADATNAAADKTRDLAVTVGDIAIPGFSAARHFANGEWGEGFKALAFDAATLVGVGLAGKLAGKAGAAFGRSLGAGEASFAAFGRASVGAAEAPIIFTRAMASSKQVIARGKSIHKIEELVRKFGGTRNGWVKYKSFDSAGREAHWYEHAGIGKKGVKWAGFPDPF
jgi:hypothetical protein